MYLRRYDIKLKRPSVSGLHNQFLTWGFHIILIRPNNVKYTIFFKGVVNASGIHHVLQGIA